MSDVILKVENVSKKFCKNLKVGMIYAGKDLVKSTFGIKPDTGLRPKEFWALQGINFELKRGETLGLIGINGAGKSTLLKLIANLIPVDKGRIEVKGRVASMISVGAGFHPHMTGRENIYLNGAILGLSKQYIDEKFDWIVDFAEVENFLDSPVSTYSSGMRVRLGFAIASCSEPDLLLLDEILSVGDRAFRIKCNNRIAELQEKCAIVFVSHSMEQVLKVCDRGVLINSSKQHMIGDIQDIIREYHIISKGEMVKSMIKKSDGIELLEIKNSKEAIEWKDHLEFSISLNNTSYQAQEIIVRVTFHDDTGRGVANWQSSNHETTYRLTKGQNTLEGRINNINLKDGVYLMSYVVSSLRGTDYILAAHNYKNILVESVPGYAPVQF